MTQTTDLPDPEKTTVVGGGPMGLAVASLVARNVDRVFLWVPDARHYDRWVREPGSRMGDMNFRVPYNVEMVTGYDHFKEGSHALFLSTPSRQFEEVTENILYHLDRNRLHLVACITKGFLSGYSRRKHGGYLFHQFVQSLRDHHNLNMKVGLVTGPSLLHDIIHNNHIFFQLATDDTSIHSSIVERLSGENIFWSYTDDTIGAEIAGIMKNPLTILSGMMAALPGVDSSFQGELLAAGFAEMRRMNLALGGREETMLGRAGLADLSSNFFSAHSRNRAYGQSFTEKLLSGESSPNFLDQLQLFFLPTMYLEREVLSNKNLAEGGLAITPLIEIAQEFKLDVPLNRMLYDILLRKKSPHEVVTLLTGKVERRNRIPVVKKKGRVELIASGRMISEVLKDRILHHITLVRGMQTRIKKQSGHIISSLEKRRTKALAEKKNQDARNFDIELNLWKNLAACRGEEELQKIEELVQFYTKAIADYYVPAARTMLMQIAAPFRWLFGGLRPGSIGPVVGGSIRSARKLATTYPVFYVPTHRTHLDSVELAYGLFFRGFPLPRFAAASSLMSNPIWGAFLKSMGAYAVDRENTRNILYLEVLTQYTTMMLESGVPALAYPEGTRSRTGQFQNIKTGLLSTAIEAFRESGHEIIVLPISISHDWVPEDLVFNDQQTRTGFWTYVFRRRRAYMDIGTPIRVSDFSSREDPTADIAAEIQRRWQSTFRVLPHFIVAKILHEHPGPLPRESLRLQINGFLSNFRGNLLEKDADRILRHGTRMLKSRRLISESKRGFEIANPALVGYYGNMIPEIATAADTTEAIESQSEPVP